MNQVIFRGDYHTYQIKKHKSHLYPPDVSCWENYIDPKQNKEVVHSSSSEKKPIEISNLDKQSRYTETDKQLQNSKLELVIKELFKLTIACFIIYHVVGFIGFLPIIIWTILNWTVDYLSFSKQLFDRHRIINSLFRALPLFLIIIFCGIYYDWLSSSLYLTLSSIILLINIIVFLCRPSPFRCWGTIFKILGEASSDDSMGYSDSGSRESGGYSSSSSGYSSSSSSESRSGGGGSSGGGGASGSW